MELFVLKLEEEKMLLNCSNMVSNAFRLNIREIIRKDKTKRAENAEECDVFEK